jgi:hypothetical protein
MRLHRALPVLVLLLPVCSVSVFGQHPHNRGGHPGGAGGHPGGAGHPGGMSHMAHPAMQQHMMMQQEMFNMMMMTEMMAREQEARRAARRSGAGPSRLRPPGNAQTGTMGHHSSGTTTAKSGMSRQQPSASQPTHHRSPGAQPANQGKAPTSQSGPQQAKTKGNDPSKAGHVGESERSEKHSSAESREAKDKAKAREKDREREKEREREAERLRRLRHEERRRYELAGASDGAMVEQLRIADGKLRSADYDYAGHKIRAMEHIHSAAAQLGSSLALGMSAFGSGNVAQQQSDQMLRESLHRLRSVEGSLGAGTNRMAHHHRARAAVAAAIREVETALRIR